MDHSLSNSVKLWVMPCRATQERWVMMESSEKMWSTGKGNGKSLQYSCLENPKNSMKREKGGKLRMNSPGQWCPNATGEEWRNNSRKNEETKPKWKQCQAEDMALVDVTPDGSKVQRCKEQYCTGTWNVRSVNQGKLEVVKQEIADVKLKDACSLEEKLWPT